MQDKLIQAIRENRHLTIPEIAKKLKEFEKTIRISDDEEEEIIKQKG